MTINLRGVSLVALTAATFAVATPSAQASSFLLGLETGPNTGSFVDIGVIDVLPAVNRFGPTGPSVGTLSQFYDLGPTTSGVGEQFNGPRDLVRDATISVFLAEGTDGLGLFTVGSVGTRGSDVGRRGGFNLEYEINQVTNFLLLDGDPNEQVINDFYFVDGTQVDGSNAFTTDGTEFRTAQRYGTGASDGSIIGTLEETGLEIFIDLADTLGEVADQNTGDENPFNINFIRVLGGIDEALLDTGQYVTTQEELFNIQQGEIVPGQRLRLTFVPAAVPVPASLALFGLGLAVAGFATRRAVR